MILWILLTVLAFDFIFDQMVEYLNLSSMKLQVPEEFREMLTVDKLARSKDYHRENYLISLARKTTFLAAWILFLVFNGPEQLEGSLSMLGYQGALLGTLFFGCLALGNQLLGLPFSYYRTFSIEARYGFNKTDFGTYLRDLAKGLVLSMTIGGAVLYGVLSFFIAWREQAWWMIWIFLVVVQIFFLAIAPVWIMPLFNKFTALEEGELKDRIFAFSKKVGFSFGKIFTMDGSKRSSKANAFFTGFGKSKRIVLFDTLIKSHTVDELVAVLAHEVGHYQRRHILRMMAISFAMTGFTLWILSEVLFGASLHLATGQTQESLPIGMLFASLMYAPVSRLLAILGHVFSRRHEFEADAYAVHRGESPLALISALKKLSVEQLSHLTPHWLKVFVDYSHPPVLKRVEAIRALGNS